jgi:hypothetical protein
MYQRLYLMMQAEKVSATLVQRNIRATLRQIRFWYDTSFLLLLLLRSSLSSRLLHLLFLLSNDRFINFCSCTPFLLSFSPCHLFPKYFPFFLSSPFLFPFTLLSFALFMPSLQFFYHYNYPSVSLALLCCIFLFLFLSQSFSFSKSVAIFHNLLLFFVLLSAFPSFLPRSKSRQIMPSS